jgi:hypothetical protein
MLVLSNSIQGREEEFERWYRQIHVPEMLKRPGFVACQRLALSEAQMGRSQPQRHLALWEIETDNLAAVYDRLRSDMASGALADCDAFDRTTAVSHTFTPITERITRRTVNDSKTDRQGKAPQ